ncbi:MAG: hypothetical protein FWC28_09150 [Proteobacteria bacterium]|nr:hypothetical protein [Cystobacterineae bacterium]MCL2258231.1 hypothetical protein [Cystobacterineae bacterium]MCL2315392.1 hypothetical protein [Pseudomonadota bacterium]
MKQLLGLLVAMPLIAWANPDMAAETTAAPAPAPKKAAAPYTLPFHLRPISAGNVVRLDNVLALYNATESTVPAAVPHRKHMKEVSILNAGYTFAPDFGILARIGIANNFPKKEGDDPSVAKPKNGTALTNGLLFFTYTPRFLGGDLRTAFYLGVTAPIGSGGGNNGSQTARGLNANSGLVRSSMDGALFLVNDMAIIPGVDVAYVAHGLTVQLELTYLEIFRVRGNEVQTEVAKRNFVGGLFVGYSIIPQLAAGVELRYQRWLKPPHGIRDNLDSGVEAREDIGNLQMHNMTIALGFRGNFKIGENTFFRPAISYAMGIAGQIADQKYHLIQLDLPFAL